MGRRPGWIATLTGRPAMWSPGRPPVRRDVERRFWVKIAEGLSSEEAAIACGVSGPVGVRWFRERGGMPSIQLTPLSGRYLSFAEREDIALLRGQGLGVRAIARALGRAPSTISRELRRNAATRGGQLDYRASIAQWKAELQARRPKTAKLASEERLRAYVQDRLAGTIARTDGKQVPGPVVRFIGRRHGRRADRRWATSWSPEQIANRLKLDFPEDETMRISHEAIYQALFIQGRGALKRELVACLRTGRALRVPRARTRGRGKQFVTPEIMITERPADVVDRAVPGHWEGDLIIGLNKSAIGTLVERTTRFTMLLHLPPMEGRGEQPRVKNGPPLAGSRRRGRPRRDRQDDRDAARTAPSVAHLGPRGRDGSTRAAPRRHRAGDLLLRPAQPVAAWDEREHQRAPAPVLPEGHRPSPAPPRRPRRRRARVEHPPAQDPRLADSRRGPRRVPTIDSTWQCCDDWLNPRCTPRSL